MLYSVEIRDQYGRLVTVLQRPRNKAFRLYRNRPGSCQFVLDLFDPQATLDNLKVNQYDVVFRRQGTPVFAGQISYLNPTVNEDNKTVEVIATGYFDLLDYRFIDADYPGFDLVHQQLAFPLGDSSQIAWKLIDDTQFPLSYDGAVLMQGPTPTLNESFVSPGTSTVSKIRVLLQGSGSPTGNVILALCRDASGTPGNVIAQTSVPASSITNLAWYDFTFSNAPAVTADTDYWIKMRLDTAQSGSNGIKWYYLNNAYYFFGMAYSPENPSLFSAGQNLQFFVLLADNSYQMTKNTYLGLTPGNLAPSVNLAPVFAQYKKIKRCIEDISSTYTGIDFAITVSIDPVTNCMKRVFNTYYPRQGIDNTSLNFSYPGNIKRFSKPRDAKTVENEVVVRGQGGGLAQLITVSRDMASIYSYGQRQDIEDMPDVDDSGTLLSLGNEYLRVRKDPLDVPTIVLDGNQPPYFGSYGIGDTIQVNVAGLPLIETLDTYRIEEIEVTVSDDDQEEISLTLSKA